MRSLIMTLRDFGTVLSRLLTGIVLIIMCHGAKAQAVSEIITDYNGFWKSSAAARNPVLPDNDHQLLSFSYGGTRYSTGVNDALLTANGQTFAAGNFRALPMQNLSAPPNGNTKIGLGAMKDGVYNGAGATAPSRSLAQYLDDGTNGLNLGTGVANLPAGSLFLSVGNILAGNIGDNIPDMLITQIADPSGTYDRYEFTDINGNRIGNAVDILLNNITPVGRWVADFYDATGNGVLAGGYTQTQRDIRLWAADFASFGIDTSNVGQIAYFKITLSGTSDIAFVAYNTTTISLNVTTNLTVPDRATRAASTAAGTRTLHAFPNPASQQVTITHDVARDNEQVILFNMMGVPVKKSGVVKGSKATSIDLAALARGCYQLVYTDGQTRSAQLLMVQ